MVSFISVQHRLESSGRRVFQWRKRPVRLAVGKSVVHSLKIDYWCGRTPVVSNASPGLVTLGTKREQAEQAMGANQEAAPSVSSAQLLPLGSCPYFPQPQSIS